MVNWLKSNLTIFIVIHVLILTSCEKKELDSDLVVATMGASLMYDGNGWVEFACTKIGAKCINKAVSATMADDFAYKIWKGTYANADELKNIDILLVQFANCKDVYGDETTFFATPEEYIQNLDTTLETNSFKQYSYAQCVDYILKKWQQICSQNNKPMHVLLVTHWHDGRTTYNEAVRKLAIRWNTEVVELDKNIGFTKDILDPDGCQPSIKYAKDTEVIDGVTFGWHPLRGKNGVYIQSKMGNILFEKLKQYISEQEIQ